MALLIFQAEAQVSAGIQRLTSDTFVTIGSDPDNKMFGEARVATGRYVGLEGTFGYNFIQRNEVNFYSGFHIGVDSDRDRDLYLGVPLGLFVKPFNTQNFGFTLEASPIFPTGRRGNYLRAGIGLKYAFR
jgi:hypothetical protein